MNIFFLDLDPKKSANYLCDKHVLKMGIEGAQLLSSAHHLTGNPNAPYKLTHANHPCSKWVRESIKNYEWLCSHCDEIFKEYTRRYKKTHLTSTKLPWLIENLPNLPNISLSEPPKCMPEIYKTDYLVTSYRNYYIGDKSRFAKWKNGNVPEWFKGPM